MRSSSDVLKFRWLLIAAALVTGVAVAAISLRSLFPQRKPLLIDVVSGTTIPAIHVLTDRPPIGGDVSLEGDFAVSLRFSPTYSIELPVERCYIELDGERLRTATLHTSAMTREQAAAIVEAVVIGPAFANDGNDRRITSLAEEWKAGRSLTDLDKIGFAGAFGHSRLHIGTHMSFDERRPCYIAVEVARRPEGDTEKN